MTTPQGFDPLSAFGPNEWLVDELYEQYLQDKQSVDPAWWGFFAGYQPGQGLGSSSGTDLAAGQTPAEQGTAPAPAKAPAPAQPAAPAKTPTSPAPAKPAAAAPTPTKPAPAAQPAAPAGKPTASTPAKDAAAAAEGSKDAPRDPGKPKETGRSGSPAPAPTPRDAQPRGEATPERQDEIVRLKGAPARTVTNMESSLEVPTATSYRTVPVKLLFDNRTVINNHLKRNRGGKVSFTHIIGYALVKALAVYPDMNYSYTQDQGKPAVKKPAHVNFGLAIDLPKPDGTRQLLVPSVKRAEDMDFAHFWSAYEDLVKKARGGKLTVEDFQGTTISLTNPGGIGTVMSQPRLMQGQGTIIGCGAMNYPAEWQGASPETIARNAISKVMTLSSTYDHRIIQGAGSGEFLKYMHELLLGEHDFYDEVFASLRIPYEPVRWSPDISTSHEADVDKISRVQQLIHAYRVRGHLMADVDPLEYRQRRHPDLDIHNHGLTLWDLEREFATGGFGGQPLMTLRDILGLLRDSYCRTVGVEYMHLQNPEQRNWVQDRVEKRLVKPTREEQLRIVRRLNAAEAFETFLQTKYVGQKRFSLEGGESVIAILDRILSAAAEDGLDEVCIGMPHRGRLNVLANIAGKSYGQIFREFDGTQAPGSVQGSGDVKYHLGTEGEFTGETGAKTRVYLAANPSHLEAVNPVLEGIVRAKLDRMEPEEGSFPVLPILLHGDASFAGQGVVQETLQMSQLKGYTTGGTIHVVVNNQVGFTTAPTSSRSSEYCTDVARMIQAPIFHVNGDDPEACVHVAEIAYEFRERFHKDVVIDMVCYRRRGHNEGDDPSMTQPLMYNLIEAKRSVRKLYTEALIGRGDITVEDAEEALKDYQAQLERVFVETKEATKRSDGGGLDKPHSEREDLARTRRPVTTAVSAETLQHIGDAFSTIPEGFTPHHKLAQLLAKRGDMVRKGGIDWGMGELLAFGTLLMEGTPVRLAGQDSRRGTFVQRHSVLIDHKTAGEWTPLAHLAEDQAPFMVFDSLLSEYAAMGFEYGYSVERPDALVLWEAQFGDFANGAQTMIDEFISSSEQKWGQHSSVVLLLPHGYEGQGPDHSSARIERYLQMCAEDNMTVAYPSTPASHFHLLRQQAYARPRRPLVVFTPKSMLRLKAAASAVEEFTTGTFERVLPDPRPVQDKDAVDRVVLCSGKVVWDLVAARAKAEDTRTAIVRVEQLAPVPGQAIAAAVREYPNAELVWLQDEPENMGAWPFMALNLPRELAKHGEERSLRVLSRPASAAPSTGAKKTHDAEQEALISSALAR